MTQLLSESSVRTVRTENQTAKREVILVLANQAIELHKQGKYTEAFMLLVTPQNVLAAQIKITFYDSISIPLPLSNLQSWADEFAGKSSLPPQQKDPSRLIPHIRLPSLVLIDKARAVIGVSDNDKLIEQQKMVALGAYAFGDSSGTDSTVGVISKLKQIFTATSHGNEPNGIYVGLLNDEQIKPHLPTELMEELSLVLIEEWLHILQDVTEESLSKRNLEGPHGDEIDVANYLAEHGIELTPVFLNRYVGRAEAVAA